MNKERREELGDVVEYLDDAIVRLEEIRDDEQDAFDDLPEGLQNSKTGDSMLVAIDKLNGFCDEIDKVKSKVEDMMHNKKKKQ